MLVTNINFHETNACHFYVLIQKPDVIDAIETINAIYEVYRRWCLLCNSSTRDSSSTLSYSYSGCCMNHMHLIVHISKCEKIYSSQTILTFDYFDLSRRQFFFVISSFCLLYKDVPRCTFSSYRVLSSVAVQMYLNRSTGVYCTKCLHCTVTSEFENENWNSS